MTYDENKLREFRRECLRAVDHLVTAARFTDYDPRNVPVGDVSRWFDDAADALGYAVAVFTAATGLCPRPPAEVYPEAEPVLARADAEAVRRTT